MGLAARSRMSRPAQNTGPAARMTARRSVGGRWRGKSRLQLGHHLAVERVALVSPVEQHLPDGTFDPPLNLGHTLPPVF